MDAFHGSRVTRDRGSREIISRRAVIFSKRHAAGKVFPGREEVLRDDVGKAPIPCRSSSRDPH